jgi:FkbM family methyltransferase
MSLHPASVLRRSAQSIRHAPGLRRWSPLWESLRTPYRHLLTALGARRGMPVTIGGYTMRLAPDVVNLSWERVEVASYRTFADQVRAGDVVFDVGAHFGTYAMIAAWRGGPGARVVAYEPCALTRGYLVRHLAWNGVADRVTVREVCCTDIVGVGAFYAHPTIPEGINGLLPAEGLVETQVRCTTLDAEVEELGLVPSLVKIDVEGAEVDVLRGAAGLLDSHGPGILVSLHPGRLAQRGHGCRTGLRSARPGATVNCRCALRSRSTRICRCRRVTTAESSGSWTWRSAAWSRAATT